MEKKIAQFMIVASKFEFFIMNNDQKFVHIDGKTSVVRGVNWERLGQALEDKFPFGEFNFSDSGFIVFKDTVPQKLFARKGGGLKWDSDEIEISTWQLLLGRSYAQLRNNIAHGNKAQLSSPFTYERTKQFLDGGLALTNFIANELFDNEYWESDIKFQ